MPLLAALTAPLTIHYGKIERFQYSSLIIKRSSTAGKLGAFKLSHFPYD